MSGGCVPVPRTRTVHRPPAPLAAAAGTGALAKDQGQPVARAAWMMTPATTPGLEIMDRCGALI